VPRRLVTNPGDGKGHGPQPWDSTSGDGSSGQLALVWQDTDAGGAEATRSVPGDTAAGMAAVPAGAGGWARHAAASTWAGARWSRFAPTRWRVRWRLVAMVVVPAITAAFLGGITIDRYASGWLAADRVQNLAQMNVSVVRLAQALEDERDLSLGYAANRVAVPDLAGKVRRAQEASASAGQAVRAGAAGIRTGAGYQATIVQDLAALLHALTNLQRARPAMASSPASASVSVQAYADQAIQAADTFSASVGNGTSDADLNGNESALGALLRLENQMSVQRGVLFVALGSSPPVLSPAALTTLLQAQQQQAADQAEFTASASPAELANFGSMAEGGTARTEEALALTNAVSGLPLTALNNVSHPKLTAPGWYGAMSATIDGTRQMADQLAAGIAARASTLRSQATSGLLVTSVLTVLLLGLAVLISTIVAKSLIRPLRKLRVDALDVASRRLPEMVRRLSESESVSESVEIDPIDVTSTDEIGEVARAFDQVHREAVRLAAHQARLRGNLSAMFVNLSRRSQMLVERQLGIIDSLEQSEQDPDRLSTLFRLDHLATRMRRNSENLLVLAGHEDHRNWGQQVPLVDVVRAAISEIEQYERIVVHIQPGVFITGRASSDVVHLIAELVENAAVFSSAQVLVTGHPLTSGGVLVQITDEGLGIAEEDLQYANWRLDNPPVIDVAVSRRMGLFVVGRLAARHGIRVRLRQSQPRGLSALVWLPDAVAELETAPLSSPPRRLFDSPASSWTPLAGEGVRAAHAVNAPAAGATSPAGLPTRMPNANFVPGSIGRPAGQQTEHQAGLAGNHQQPLGARRRSPEEARSRLAEFQHGARQGRSDAPNP
jgi:signal transduction histidine kinase